MTAGRTWFILNVALIALAPLLASAQERIALVIGNSSYASAPLANPVNDANDMAAELRRLGFKVVVRTNASQAQVRSAVREFGVSLRRAQVGLFYFAGHGLQIGGSNFLVPVGADINTEADAEDQSINMHYVMRTMEESGVKVSIVILDACRNNPYSRGFRSAARGLAQMSAATGSLIAFSTAPGSVAADGAGRNGIYTKHLLVNLRHPDTDILKVFQRTRAAVIAETAGLQTPWESTSLVGDFHFRARAVASAPAPATVASADARAEERLFWESIKDSHNPPELQAYLDRYPEGLFAPLARARLASGGKVTVAAAAADGLARSTADTVARLNKLLSTMVNRPTNQKESVAAGKIYSEIFSADAEGLRYRTWRCGTSLIKGCEPEPVGSGLIRFSDLKVDLKDEERCGSGPGAVLFGRRCIAEKVLRVSGAGAFSEDGWDVLSRGFDTSSIAITQELFELLRRQAQ